MLQPRVTITTPYGVFDSEFDDRGLPPTVLRYTPTEEVREDVSIVGTVLLTQPFHLGGRVNLVIPDEYAQPLSQARPLQQCRPGDRVEITENMTGSGSGRTYAALVTEADGGAWVGTDDTGEPYYTLVMAFRTTT